MSSYSWSVKNIKKTFSNFELFENGYYLKMNGHFRAPAAAQELKCSAQILLPKVLVLKKNFDFGTGYIGDTFKVFNSHASGVIYCSFWRVASVKTI